jgi:predicted DNA-binding transcriptional regulator AlpA
MDTEQGNGERQCPVQGALLKGWLTRDEVAAQIGVSIDTLQRWQSIRVGPPTVRLGRRVLYRADAFREWLVSRERNLARRA